MYMILGKAIADVDANCFDKIGCIDSGVLACPTMDQTLAIKGSVSSPLDSEVECQHTLFITYEADKYEIEDSLEPGLIYRYRENSTSWVRGYRSIEFVELKCEQSLGRLKVVVYFLVPSSDCEFAVSTDDGMEPYTLRELWQDGFVRRLNNG